MNKIVEYKSQIKRIDRVASDAIKIYLAKLDTLEFDYGQFVTLVATINGEQVTRAYSITSLPEEKDLMLYVKVVPNGKMTTYLNNLKKPFPGILLKGPFGVLTPEHIGQDFENIVLIGAGSGIASLRPLAYYYSQVAKKQVTVVHQEKRQEYLVFKDDFIKWGVNYIPILSRQQVEGVRFGHFQDFLQDIEKPNAKYLAIGGKAFVEAVKQSVNSDNILIEAW